MISFGRQPLQGRGAIGLAALLLLVGIPLINALAADPTGVPSNNQALTGSPGAREQDGQRMVLSRCAVCHSTDLIVQQRLTREKWAATVSKMVHWGAQLSASDETLLVDYLAERYHPGRVDRGESGAAAETSLSNAMAQHNFQTHPSGRVQQGQTVYRQNCLPCHGEAAAGGMGPKLAKNPILVNERLFWETVRQGRGTMPAWNSMLSVQEIADVEAWLKTLE